MGWYVFKALVSYPPTALAPGMCNNQFHKCQFNSCWGWEDGVRARHSPPSSTTRCSLGKWRSKIYYSSFPHGAWETLGGLARFLKNHLPHHKFERVFNGGVAKYARRKFAVSYCMGPLLHLPGGWRSKGAYKRSWKHKLPGPIELQLPHLSHP